MSKFVIVCYTSLGLTQKQFHILDADASRPAVLQKLGISRYSGVFVPCQPGASTPKIANLFSREPLTVTSHLQD